MIEKKSKNSIQWLGAGPGCNTKDVTDALLALKEELVELENKEMELDQHYSWAKQSILNIMDDPENKSFSYVLHDDLVGMYPDSTLLVVQAPSGTQLEVPNVSTGSGSETYFRSDSTATHDILPGGSRTVYGGLTSTSLTSTSLIQSSREAGSQSGGIVSSGRGSGIIHEIPPASALLPLNSHSLNTHSLNSQSVLAKMVPGSSVGRNPPQVQKRKYQMHLKSRSGPINVFLVNHSEDVVQPSGGVDDLVIEEETTGNKDSKVEDREGAGEVVTNGGMEEVTAAKVGAKRNSQSEEVVHAATRTSTRSSARSADKTSADKTSADKTSADKTPADKTSADKTATEKPAAEPNVRTLSPRRAAQKHLFISSKRGIDQVPNVTGSRSKAASTVTRVEKDRVEKDRGEKDKDRGEKDTDSDGSAVELVTGSASVDEGAIDENKAINNRQSLVRGVKRPRLSVITSLDQVVADVQQPLVRLSPPPSGRDYCFNLDDSEGATDLFLS